MTYPVRPIPQATIDAIRDVAGDDEIEMLALVSVETNGVGCEDDGTPVFLCEPATFYNQLPEAKRNAALRAGIAARKWSRRLYGPQKTHALRVKLLGQMVAMDEDAAYRSISMGIGQVMGFHAEELGFGSAKGMWEAWASDLDAQLRGMLAVAVKQGVIAALKARKWAVAARAYNGSQFRQNAYDTKLATAFAHWETAVGTGQLQPPEKDSNVFGLGSAGDAVAALQRLLVKAQPNVPIKPDGMFGPLTVGAVLAFQGRAMAGTQATGLVDQSTADAIATRATEAPLAVGARETAGLAQAKAALPAVAAAAKARAGAVATGVAGVAAVAKKGFDQASSALDQVGSIHGKLTGIVGEDTMAVAGKAALSAMTGATLPLCIVGGGFTAAVVFHGLVQAGLIDFRRGATA